MTWQGATYPTALGRCDTEVVAVQSAFRRGDANDDGRIDISDAVFTLGCKFLGEACPGCRDAADFNDDGRHDISDAVATLGFLYLGSPPPPAPGALGCGRDPVEDSLPDCEYRTCPATEW